MKFNKKISKSGSVTLPAALRREVGLAEDEKFVVEAKHDGTIVLSRAQPQCILTGAQDDLIVFAGKYVSRSAIEAMHQISRSERA